MVDLTHDFFFIIIVARLTEPYHDETVQSISTTSLLIYKVNGLRI